MSRNLKKHICMVQILDQNTSGAREMKEFLVFIASLDIVEDQTSSMRPDLLEQPKKRENQVVNVLLLFVGIAWFSPDISNTLSIVCP